MEFKDLTPELKEKAKACKSTEELMTLAQSIGAELTDEQLEQITGGEAWNEGWFEDEEKGCKTY